MVFKHKVVISVLLFNWLTFCMFMTITLIIVPSKRETVYRLPYMLFSTLITYEKIYQESDSTVKFMTDFRAFSSCYTCKCVSLNNVYAYLISKLIKNNTLSNLFHFSVNYIFWISPFHESRLHLFFVSHKVNPCKTCSIES